MSLTPATPMHISMDFYTLHTCMEFYIRHDAFPFPSPIFRDNTSHAQPRRVATLSYMLTSHFK
ncbi:hypothetical protein E2C01_076287 [Portunus trituberculatus]|uniref:Uncharacterized protein n=1 Tax=Portunus trituberculatus TaxID=210409 RepID=A0A5B7IIJ1_PORTR|nr:hypothetical protein [Portunus trituberculatus]